MEFSPVVGVGLFCSIVGAKEILALVKEVSKVNDVKCFWEGKV
jgi:hypothetical protein